MWFPHRRLYLNTFRGEPAISGFAWHFTATLRSSLPFVTDTGSGLHVRIPLASPCPRVDHPVSGHLHATRRPLRLAFAPAPPVRWLNLATCTYSLAHSTKGTPSHPEGRSDRPEAHGFRISFTPLGGVLFTFPSRYWCTIGRLWYLALDRGRPCFPPDFSCPVVLTLIRHRAGPVFAYGTLTLSGRPFQQRSAHRPLAARPLSWSPRIAFNPVMAAATASYAITVWAPPGSLAATTGILSVPRGTEMFQFPRFPPRLTRGPASRQGVAPFGYRRIIGCQHLPDAFRRVATSFLGHRHPGIHRVPVFRIRSGDLRAVFCLLRGARGDVSATPHACNAGGVTSSLVKVHAHRAVEPRGLEPRTSAVQGRRSPN